MEFHINMCHGEPLLPQFVCHLHLLYFSLQNFIQLLKIQSYQFLAFLNYAKSLTNVRAQLIHINNLLYVHGYSLSLSSLNFKIIIRSCIILNLNLYTDILGLSLLPNFKFQKSYFTDMLLEQYLEHLIKKFNKGMFLNSCKN